MLFPFSTYVVPSPPKCWLNLAESGINGDEDVNMPLLLDPGQEPTDFQVVDRRHPGGR